MTRTTHNATTDHDGAVGARRIRLGAFTAPGAAVVALATLVFALLAPARPARAGAADAAPAALYVSGADAPVAAGDTFTVQLRLRSDTQSVNAVQADLTYPAAAVQYVSAQVNDGAWGVTASNTGGAGAVSIQVGTTTPVSGDTPVARVTFKAQQSVTPGIAVADSSLALSADTHTNLLVPPSTNGGGPPPTTGDGGPQPPGGGGDGVHPPVPVRVRISGVHWRGRTLRVHLTCPAAAPSQCRVGLSLRLHSGHRVGRSTKSVIRPGRTRTAVIKLPAATARRARRHAAAFRLQAKTVTSAGVLYTGRRLPSRTRGGE